MKNDRVTKALAVLFAVAQDLSELQEEKAEFIVLGIIVEGKQVVHHQTVERQERRRRMRPAGAWWEVGVDKGGEEVGLAVTVGERWIHRQGTLDEIDELVGLIQAAQDLAPILVPDRRGRGTHG